MPAEAHPGTLAADGLVLPDDGGAGAAVDARPSLRPAALCSSSS